MGRTNLTLHEILDQTFTDYNAVQDLDARGYYLADRQQGIYTIIIVPEPSHAFFGEVGVILLARVVGEDILIERDTTDRPLVKALVAAGIPREQIILAYAGESYPLSAEVA